MSRYQNTSKATEQGRVVLNGQRDSVEIRKRLNRKEGSHDSKTKVELYKGSRKEGENFHIMEGEIVLQDKMRSKLGKRGFTDLDAQGFTSLNGMYLNTAGMETDLSISREGPGRDEKVREAKRSKLAFLGVAGTRALYDPNQNSRNETAAVFQVGGIKTIPNTGPDDIHLGDRVMWDLPTMDEHRDRVSSNRLKGTPRDKILVSTKKYDPKSPVSKFSKKNLAQAWKCKENNVSSFLKKHIGKHHSHLYNLTNFALSGLDENSGKDEINQKLKNTLENDHFFNTIVDIQRALDEEKGRIFGRAVSNGAKGKYFDIMIGKYC